jgi:hypothetical protein
MRLATLSEGAIHADPTAARLPAMGRAGHPAPVELCQVSGAATIAPDGPLTFNAAGKGQGSGSSTITLKLETETAFVRGGSDSIG